jgi:hypothetical protein
MRGRSAALLALLLTGCGSGSESAPTGAGQATTSTAEVSPAPNRPPEWTKPYLAKPGPVSALVTATSDHQAGENRVTFLVVRSSGELIQSPVADIFFAPADAQRPQQAKAVLVPLGPHSHPTETTSHDHADTTDLYVTRLRLPDPGRYWLVVQPRGERIQSIGVIQVRRRTVSPPIGTKAIPSDNPTLADAPAAEITTASPPDTELLRYSIRDTMRARKPFVVVFATPEFCQSRACGPTVEVAQKLHREFGPKGIRFIHVEIYEENEPRNGVNRWVKEWKLPTEPWVFVVDREGRIRAKFEGSASVQELRQAVRQYLL